MSKKDEHWQDLRELVVKESKKLKPLTQGQARLMSAIDKFTVTLCDGCAGTGKSYMTARGRGWNCCKRGKIQRIIISRPLVSCGRGYGFLPGERSDKMVPFMRPILETMSEQIGQNEVNKLIAKESITFCPLDDMRWSNSRTPSCCWTRHRTPTAAPIAYVLDPFRFRFKSGCLRRC